MNQTQIQNKINQYIVPLSNTRTKFINRINRQNFIKNSFRNLHDRLMNNNMTNIKIIDKLCVAFEELHQHLKKISTIHIENNIEGETIKFEIQLLHNENKFYANITISLIDKIVYIEDLQNDTSMKSMIYYPFLFINYILSILFDYDLDNMLEFQIKLKAVPLMRAATNKNISTNNRKLYEYYESFGFVPVKNSVQQNRLMGIVGNYQFIEYYINYSKFIVQLYYLILRFAENNRGSFASFATSSRSNSNS